jgi:hypothetical protein
VNKILIALVFALASSTSAWAADQCTSWGCISTVANVVTNADGVIYVGTPLDESLANCTAVSGVYFTIDTTSGNAKEMYASVLAAYMSNKKIQLRVKEGHPLCELSYVNLSTDF